MTGDQFRRLQCHLVQFWRQAAMWFIEQHHTAALFEVWPLLTQAEGNITLRLVLGFKCALIFLFLPNAKEESNQGMPPLSVMKKRAQRVKRLANDEDVNEVNKENAADDYEREREKAQRAQTPS